MAEATPPAVVPPEVERGQFVETFTVREGNKRFEVAVNAVANKALMQINVSKLRALATRTLELYEKHPEMPPSPKELKILADAMDTIEDLGARAYSDSKAAKGLGNSLERLVFSLAAGNAAGNAMAGNTPGQNSPEARMKRLANIGKMKAAVLVPPAEQPAIDLNE